MSIYLLGRESGFGFLVNEMMPDGGYDATAGERVIVQARRPCS